MTYHVYFPQDLLKSDCSGVLLGFKYGNVFVCIIWVSQLAYKTVLSSIKDLTVIGSKDGMGYFRILHHSSESLPIFQASDASHFTIIIFNPPNYKNLEYFTINPIFLQSMGDEHSHVSPGLQTIYDNTFPLNALFSSIANEDILDKINLVQKLRAAITSKLADHGFISSIHLQAPKIVQQIRMVLFRLFTYVVLAVQIFTVTAIQMINYKLLGFSLVDISQVFRQLDLRLKQIAYFPIQFLCYYDKNILYKDNSILLQELGLPAFNSDLNINNSNYINLYNSLWLIINDILMGTTVWTVLSHHREYLLTILKDTVFEAVLIDGLFDIIGWISYRHPAGFKLNNELGKFMGDLFLWSLTTWSIGIKSLITPKTIQVAHLILQGLSYMGVTFLIAIAIDFINIITLHIFWFYQTASRIYQKQLQIIMSLFQLFRGKKYNVLRNRVDNINNYSEPNEFEIDHLLLGTVFFMVLILLLPTIFGFYLLFFLLRLAILLSQNFCENLLIIINFLPIFVMLLKLKNSNRLQGGVTFELQEYQVLRITYLRLCNKSLTYSEIFHNFRLLFKRLKNFRTSLATSFLKGELISLNHNYNLKFHYLMLPENFQKSVDIWRYFTTEPITDSI